MPSHIDSASISQFVQHINESKDPIVSAKVFADFLEEHGNHLAQALREHRHNASGVKADYNHSLHLQSPHMTTFIAPATGEHEGDFVVETGVQGVSGPHWFRSRQSRRDVDKIVDRVKRATNDHDGDISHFYNSLGMEEPGAEEVTPKEKMNRRKRTKVKFARWVSHDEIAPFEESKVEEIKQLPQGWYYTGPEYQQLSHKHNAIISDFFQENQDPRYHLTSPFKGVDSKIVNSTHLDYDHGVDRPAPVSGTIHKDNGEKMSVHIKPMYYSPALASSNGIKNPEHTGTLFQVMTADQREKSGPMILHHKYLKPEEVHEFVGDMPDGPHKEAFQKYLNEHFPLPEEPQPEKMNRHKRSKVKFARWVKEKEINQFDHKDDVSRMALSDYLQEQGDPRHIFFDPKTRISRGDTLFHLDTHQWNPLPSTSTIFISQKNKKKGPLVHLAAMLPDPKIKIDDEFKSDPRFTTDPFVLAGYLTGGRKLSSHSAKLSPEQAYDWIHSLPGGPPKELKSHLESYFPHLNQTNEYEQPERPEKMSRGNSAWRTRYQRAINNVTRHRKESEKIKKQKVISNLIRFFRNK